MDAQNDLTQQGEVKIVSRGKIEGVSHVKSNDTREYTNQENVKKDNNESNNKEIRPEIVNTNNSPKEEEDVPDQFFNDFLECIDDLDIVDDAEWDNQKKADVSKNSNNEDVKTSDHKNKCSKNDKIDHVENFRSWKQNHPEATDIENRRDPERTKRDIHNYKMKCMKENQKKLLAERLDSGLVPPGMEMEVDTLKEDSDMSDLRDKIRRPRSKSPNRDRRISAKNRLGGYVTEDRSRANNSSSSQKKMSFNRLDRKKSISPRRRSKSPIRRKSKSPIRRRSKSPNRRKSKSPIRGRLKSPIRGRLPSPINRGSKSPIRRNRSKSRDRKRSTSINRDKFRGRLQRSRSRSRDRSRAIIRDRRRSRSRSSRRHRLRSNSPRRRSRSRSRGANKKAKYIEKSFLEEIAEKLNERTRPIAYPTTHLNPPTYAQPSIYPPTYNQEFYLKNTNLNSFPTDFAGIPPNCQSDNNLVTPPIIQQSFPPVVPVQQQNPPNVPDVNHSTSVVVTPINISKMILQPTATLEEKNMIAKLYEEKKISLSDYLCIAAKPEVQSTKPEMLKEQVKVISRCQEAINFMEHGPKFVGRLNVNFTDTSAIQAMVKNKSPLLRGHCINFPFTTPPKILLPSQQFSAYLQDMLKFCGVAGNPISDESELNNSEEELEDTPAKSIIIPNKKIFVSEKCEECEIRKRKTYKQRSTQCEPPAMKTIETQVSEEDILPKKRSLAALTPAQLLGMKKEAESTNFRLNPPTHDLRGPAPRTFHNYNPMMNPWGRNPRYSRF